LYKFAGDFEQAAAWYRKTIETFPHDATGYVYLGCLLARQGRLLEAEEVHRAGTQCIEGCLDEAFLNLGFVLRAREQFEEAAECFREAIRQDPAYKAAKEALRDVVACIKECNRS
jgi:tetratricopeptide (TPR) repeat protein